MAMEYNFKPQNDNFYKRLDLGEDASTDDIKRAFFKAVTFFPPEKDTENHKLIREAYDVLINPHSREEYNTRKNFGLALEKLETELVEYEKEEDSYNQIKVLKKILNMAPNMSLYRNKLGLAYLSNEDSDKALTQFTKAHDKDIENPVYLLNMGHAEEGLDNYHRAEQNFTKAWNIDKDDYSPPRALANLYFHKLNQKTKAYQILDDAIESDGKLDFLDFFCIYDKIHLYLFDHNKSGLQRELDRVESIAISDEDKEFSAFMLSRTGAELFDIKIFKLSIKFMETAHTLCPNNIAIKNLYMETKKEAKLLDNIEKVMKSKKVHELVKFLISLYSEKYYGNISSSEFQEQVDKMKNGIINIMDVDPDSTKVKDSLNFIRRSYNNVFELNYDLFNSLINFSAATGYSSKCPSCSDFVRVSKYQYDNYVCPHCNTSINYSSSGYSIRSSYGSSNSGCFIATAVYQDYNHPQVLILRQFRDEVLNSLKWTKKIVSLYYYVSPPVAKFLRKQQTLSKLVKLLFLNPLVKLIKIIMNY